MYLPLYMYVHVKNCHRKPRLGPWHWSRSFADYLLPLTALSVPGVLSFRAVDNIIYVKRKIPSDNSLRMISSKQTYILFVERKKRVSCKTYGSLIEYPGKDRLPEFFRKQMWGLG